MKKPISLAAATLFAATSLYGQADLSHRKADLVVHAQTASGTPLEGATVEIEMLNHAFRFGCSVEYHLVNPESGAYDAKTVENLQTYFNSTTYGNVMKWSYFEDQSEAENLAIAALPSSLSAFDGPDPLRLRGHVTIWGASYQVPARVRNSNDPAYIHEQILSHIQDYHTTFKDAGVDNYDLYNEHFHQRSLLIDKIVPGGALSETAAEVALWFNQAKEADPDAILYINEYNILNFWLDNDADVIAYKEFVDAVRDAGGQVDGIGLQAHMDRPTTTKERVTRRLDLLAADMPPTENHPNGLPGLSLEITELDMSINNSAFNNPSWPNPTMEQQVAVTEAVLTGAFEHPAVEGITIWGMNDSDHWRDNAILFDDSDPENWQVKGTGQVWIDKVLGEWWEDHSGTTSTDGAFTANTFNGTHRVTVTFNGESQEAIVDLSEDDSVTLNFTAEADDAVSYDSWSTFIEWETADSVRTADPDLDGRDNLEEFIFGTDPLVHDIATSPQLLLSATEADFIEYSVRARSEGLVIQVLKSVDLVTWTPLESLLSGVDIVEGQARHALRFNDSELEPTPEEGSVFYRVRFTEQSSE